MKRILFLLFFALLTAGIGHVWAAEPSVIRLHEGQALPNPGKDKALVIYFNATWCGPCRTFAPIFEQAAKDYSKKAVFVSVDVDNNGDLARSFSVRSIPYVVVMRQGKDPVTHMGMMTRDEFKAFLDSALR